MVLVVWHNLSELLAGRPHGPGLLASVILLPLFVLVAHSVGRTVARMGRTE